MILSSSVTDYNGLRWETFLFGALIGTPGVKNIKEISFQYRVEK
jgi:hypothetical protein